jgi:hypothetical protein
MDLWGTPEVIYISITFCVFLIYNLKNYSFLRRVIDQLFKSYLTFCVFCFLIYTLKNQCVLRRVVHSQSIVQRQLRRKI